MSKWIIDSSTLTDIADAIREKTGSQESIQVDELATEICGLPDGIKDFETGSVFVNGSGATGPSAGKYVIVGNHVLIDACLRITSTSGGSSGPLVLNFTKSDGTLFPATGDWAFNPTQMTYVSNVLFEVFVKKSDGSIVTPPNYAIIPNGSFILTPISSALGVSVGDTVHIKLQYIKGDATFGTLDSYIQSGYTTFDIQTSRSQNIATNAAKLVYTRIGNHVYGFGWAMLGENNYGQWAKFFPTFGKNINTSKALCLMYDCDLSGDTPYVPVNSIPCSYSAGGVLYFGQSMVPYSHQYYFVTEYDLTN